MTSAPNRLQPLSGNKAFLLLLLMAALTLGACKAKKKTVEQPHVPPTAAPGEVEVAE